MGRNYTSEKPADCRCCYFWKDDYNGCERGGESNCYYAAPGKNGQDNGKCAGCPYAKDHPCIGFCMIKVMNKGRADYMPAGRQSCTKPAHPAGGGGRQCRMRSMKKS